MKESDMARILKGSMFLSLGSVLITIIDTIAFAIIARILSQVEMGVAIAFELIYSAAILISDFGFTTALIKYISEFRGSKRDYKPLISAGIILRVLIATSIALLCISASPHISLILLKTEKYSYLFLLVGINIIITCLNSTLRSILWGLNEIKKIVAIDLFNTFFGQIVILALLLSGWGLTGYFIGLVTRGFLYTSACLFFLFKTKHIKKYPFRTILKNIKQLAQFSLSVFANSIVNFSYEWFDKGIILSYLTLSDLAIYGVAYKIYRILHKFPENIRTTLFPLYGEHYGEKDFQSISSIIKKVIRYQSLMYTPIAIGLAVIAPYAITLFVGEQYVSADIILVIFCIFSTSIIFNPNFSNLLFIFNKPQSVFLLNLAQIIISLAITPIFLIYLNLGITGIALVKATAIPITVVLFYLHTRKILSIEFDKEALSKGFLSGFIMALTVKIIVTLFPAAHMVPIYIAVGGTTYFIMLKLTRAINNEDIELASEVLGEKLKPVIRIMRILL